MLKNQQSDGSWKAGGQLPLGKRPARETTEVTTMWTLLALNSYDAETIPPEIRTRADAFLAAAEPGKSTEWHVARLLLQPGRETLRAELLKQQHADGGWGWLAASPSDAYGTGRALYALARRGVAPDDKAIERAVEFLKTTQQADGSWAVPSTRARDKDRTAQTQEALTFPWRSWNGLNCMPKWHNGCCISTYDDPSFFHRSRSGGKRTHDDGGAERS